MKKKYETPVVENLVFDYTDVVVASGFVTSQSSGDGCTINGKNGFTFENGSTCTKDHSKNANKDCW